MLQQLTLKDFQAHANSVLEFDPHVNVIVGPTDKGKSSIIRALRWLIQNKPSGDSYIRYEQKEVNACIVLNENKITRVKGKSNVYSINNEKYEGFGQDVPEEVKKVLNFSPINFQYQMDSPFLLSESSGEISRYLNKIANLEVMDISIKNLTSSKRKTEQEIAFTQKEIRLLEEQLKNFADLEAIEKLIVEGESIVSEIQELKQEYSKVSSVIESIPSLQIELEEFNTIKEEKKLINEGLELYAEWKKEDKECHSLVVMVDTIEDRKKVLEQIETSISLLKKEYKKLMPKKCPLCGKS